MSKSTTSPGIDAVFGGTRLISESVSSAPARPAPQNKTSQVQVRTETSSNMTASVDNPMRPEILAVELTYKVVHKADSDGRELVKYEAVHGVHFTIRAISGVSDLGSLPTEALTGYFALAHAIARRRAEHTFIDMGFHGVVLPIPDEYASPAKLPEAAKASAG